MAAEGNLGLECLTDEYSCVTRICMVVFMDAYRIGGLLNKSLTYCKSKEKQGKAFKELGQKEQGKQSQRMAEQDSR